MLKRIRLIIIAVTISFTGIMPISKVNAETVQDISIKYQGHVQNIGWQTGYVNDGGISGTSGRSLRIEALRLELASQISGVKVLVRTHVQNIGWSDWVSSDAANKLEIGTTGSGLRMEAFQIKLEGAPAGYHISYQAHVQNIGWQEWVEDGAISGSTGKSLRIEALKIKIVKGPDSDLINPSNGKSVDVEYSPHIQNIGWEAPVRNGELAGTIGQALRLEALNISLVNPIPGMKIKSQAHVQNIGWLPEVESGTVMGTSGMGLRIEALKLTLEGAPAGYHIQYQAYVQNIGWQNWFEDGGEAGTHGQSLRIEALRIRISNKALPNFEEQTTISYNMTLKNYTDLQISRCSYPLIDYYLNYDNFKDNGGRFQFLRIDTYREVQSVEQINDLLEGKGILEGKGEAFIKAAKLYNIDPIYFIAHTILETGYGKSALATGVTINEKVIGEIYQKDADGNLVKDAKGQNILTELLMEKLQNAVTVYNLYGIGAYDNTVNVPDRALKTGTTKAYNEGWDTVDKAIVGAAKFISSNYVNHSTYKQNTLYKMKWNWNSNNVWHQYATDPAWANSISKLMNSYSYLYKGAKLTFETPVFKAE